MLSRANPAVSHPEERHGDRFLPFRSAVATRLVIRVRFATGSQAPFKIYSWFSLVLCFSANGPASSFRWGMAEKGDVGGESESIADKYFVCTECLVEGNVQSFVDLFYLVITSPVGTVVPFP